MSKSRPFPDGEDFANCRSGACQHALEADDDEITEQVGLNVFGASALVFLLKLPDRFADGSFDLALSFHRGSDSETVAKICSNFPKSPGLTKW